MNIKFPNGSEIIFLGLDEETKLLSLANISCIFVEEVFEVEQSKFEQLDLRMRGKAKQPETLLRNTKPAILINERFMDWENGVVTLKDWYLAIGVKKTLI